MILLWDSVSHDTDTSIAAANNVEVSPLGGPRSEENPYNFIHKQGNGGTINQNIGWNELVTFTLSEDELSRSVTVGGTVYYVFQLVKEWRRAKFMWVQDALINGGEYLGVSHLNPYKDATVQSMNDMNEVAFSVIGKVFHYNQ